MEACRDIGNDDNERLYPHGGDNTSEDSNIRTNGNIKRENGDSRFSTSKELANKTILGNHFWSRGYCVTTVGIDEEKIRRYVKYQEDAEWLIEDHELQPGLF